VQASVLAAAVVLFAAPALRAQKSADPTMPLPSGVNRDKAAEAAAGGAGDGTDGRLLQMFRVGAPIEMLIPWYLRQMSPYEDSPLDTTRLQPGESTPMSYHITYHAWKDQCMDPADTAAESDSAGSDPSQPCKRWRRGIDKQRALNNSRVSLPGGRWVKRFTITWFTRGAGGEMTRRQIELRDAGLADNWQHDYLKTLITLERTTTVAGQ
jgi:hypothetical protein